MAYRSIKDKSIFYPDTDHHEIIAKIDHTRPHTFFDKSNLDV